LNSTGLRNASENMPKLLAKPCIYLSPFFTLERESAARANIARALTVVESCV
jgi:hypothetical protein